MKAIHFICFGLMLVGTFTLAQSNPVPFVNQPLVPDAVAPGASSFTLTVNGTGFVSGAIVNWNGAPLNTTFVSSSQLTATVPASDIAVATTASVTVVNPTPAGGTSNVQFFSVSSPVARPTFATSVQGIEFFGNDQYSTNLVAADFNGDGMLDLAGAISRDDYLSIFIGNGDGSFQSPKKFDPGNDPVALVAADFNGDGKIDLAVANFGENTVSILLGNGDGTFQRRVPVAVASIGQAPMLAADLNGDGNLDLAIVGDDGFLYVLLGNGDGTFKSPISTGQSVQYMTVGDFNGDGKLDLAVDYIMNGGGGFPQFIVGILLGNGDGTFQPINTVSDLGEAPMGRILAADVNADGRLDLITDGYSGPLILLGNGDGTFQLNTTSDSTNVLFLLANVNADSKLDLFGIGGSQGSFSLLLGNGDGAFQPTIGYPNEGGVTTYPGLAGDFNGDGKLDVVFSSADPLTNVPELTVVLQGQFPITEFDPPFEVNFGEEDFGATTNPSEIDLFNIGNATLSVSNISITGPNATDFALAQSPFPCGAAVVANSSCSIFVSFTPGGAGPRNAALAITDNAPGSPQIIALSGKGLSLDLTTPAGGINSATVAAGGTATYTLSIGGGGLSGVAAVTCVAPATVVCTVPSTVSVSDSNASTFTVSVSTTAATSAALRKRNSPAEWLWATALLGVVIVPKADKGVKRKLRRLGWLPLLLIVFITSCGGGNSSSGAGAADTPAGTYTITVTASLGDTAQSQTLKLIVQ